MYSFSIVEAQGALSRHFRCLPRHRHPVEVLEELQICGNPQVRFTEIDEDAKVGNGIRGKFYQFNSIVLQDLGEE